MKVAISGKGGVGKTTVSALLAAALALQKRHVLAVDADPDANLPSALGVPCDEVITPLSQMTDLIKERTGAADAYGGYFKLNPHVQDIPEKFARRVGGNIHLLVLGGVSKGGGGCICPATALLKALMVHLVLGREEAVIMDMEAGIEHLGRATAQSMKALLLVVDEGPWSVATAHRVKALAGDLGLTKLFAVINRVTPTTDVARIRQSLNGIPVVGQLPMDPRLVQPLFTVNGEGIVPSAAMLEHLPAANAILDQLSALE